jgi:epoxyqueuosine reductase QueG
MENILQRLIDDFVKEYMKNDDVKTRWKKPLVAFADATDPLFHKLREVANPEHLLPEDILSEARTVITYFLPFEEFISESNIGSRNSSEIWARAYVETNRLISSTNDFLIDSIRDMGYNASKLNPKLNMDYEKLLSVWSNRHVAYIAGLGTFGLNNMLITKKGCCGRLGNVVTDLLIEPTERPKTEYCLSKYNGSCTACVDNCVNDALFTDEFNRFKCYDMCKDNHGRYSTLGGEADVCGKCLVGIPCSYENPNE